MSARYDRQSFLGPTSERVLRERRVGVIGLGGGGSQVVQQLAHVGVGALTVVDDDVVEEHNLNRLVGATADDARRATRKVDVAQRLARGINPRVDILPVAAKWQERGELLRDCDVIFGCVDSYGARSELEATCRRFLLPYIDVGMDVTAVEDWFMVSGQVILSMPGQPCMWCLGFLTEDRLAREAERYGAAGSRPQVVWSNGALVCAAVGLFMQLVTPWHKAHRRVEYLEYDGNTHTIARSNRLLVVRGGHCPHYPTDNIGDPYWAGCAADRESSHPNPLDRLPG